MKKKQASPLVEQTVSPGLRKYLYFTAAITGGAIMIIEILGAKMLAPYVGTSHFVWTAQIAVTLMALAAGYYMGGRFADNLPQLKRLYFAILWAAVYLCLAVLLTQPVAYWCLRFKLAAGTLLASLLLFFIPLALLAMVGPFFIRMLTLSVSGVGGNVGRLTAISTLGSFVGTVLIGYVLIPFLPNSTTMLLTAGGLMAIAAIYFLLWERKSKAAVLAAVLLGIGIAFGAVQRERGARFDQAEEVHRSNSNFGQLQVVQTMDGSHRYYLNDFLMQNTYDPATGKSTSLFTSMLHGLARVYTPRIENALCIGMGVGIVPMQFAREGVKVAVVEINPAVVPVARKYFGCEPERFALSIGDGRYFLNSTARKFDAVILDAFLGDSSPSHLMTKEAFTAIRQVLTPSGTLVINSFADVDSKQDFFGASLAKTLKSVFPSVRIHDGRNGNVFFVASSQPELNFVHPIDVSQVHNSVQSQARATYNNIVEADPRHGIVLTDNFNPVDFYDAANREDLRRRLALSIREL